ncbi:hypothetical protein H6P81_020227 [Aristolochia fimbriata]|uniref:PB1 domain-containing protein n=1 Tax=Aristolochia fimbriata TaxID=158543 RepID=A0AAV7DTX1_ARIFI|nr:hypothetical protein H6P81_020227 [Aristolochia fimbriata]
MENYSYSSYPDSGDSSPRSREVDCDNASWDEHQAAAAAANYKVKFMCSYGGKIQPRPHDNQLAYIGGDTKILAVDRSIKFSGIMAKLSAICDVDVCFKYQLPGEDLDALISVTNDEDLDHMMMEYDRLHRASVKPARLRLFLFPLNPPPPTAANFPPAESKTDRQWFVDALNSAPIQNMDSASPTNPDFLFGLDKGYAQPQAKLQEAAPESVVTDVASVETPVGSDLGKEDRQIGGGEQSVSPAEIQRQIHELQRLQIANQEQAAMYQRRSDEGLPRVVPAEYYAPKSSQEKMAPPPVNVTVPQAVTAAYWPERQLPAGAIQSVNGTDQPVYLIPAGTQGMYPPGRPGQVSHGYYVQRMVPEAYRETQPVYAPAPVAPPPAVTKVADMGYGQVGYDASGRQVFYTAAPGGGGVPTSYQTVTAAPVDMRQTELKVPITKTAQAS